MLADISRARDLVNESRDRLLSEVERRKTAAAAVA
jgi:hypothetical protein